MKASWGRTRTNSLLKLYHLPRLSHFKLPLGSWVAKVYVNSNGHSITAPGTRCHPKTSRLSVHLAKIFGNLLMRCALLYALKVLTPLARGTIGHMLKTVNVVRLFD